MQWKLKCLNYYPFWLLWKHIWLISCKTLLSEVKWADLAPLEQFYKSSAWNSKGDFKVTLLNTVWTSCTSDYHQCKDHKLCLKCQEIRDMLIHEEEHCVVLCWWRIYPSHVRPFLRWKKVAVITFEHSDGHITLHGCFTPAGTWTLFRFMDRSRNLLPA